MVLPSQGSDPDEVNVDRQLHLFANFVVRFSLPIPTSDVLY